MTTISAATVAILSHPMPVLIVDTCNFLDLFRREVGRPKWLPAEEIRAASILIQMTAENFRAVHLVVPELVPIEFQDNADDVEKKCEKWIQVHDTNQIWLAEVGQWVKVVLPETSAVQPVGLHGRLRALATDLLGRALVLDRDAACLDRAVARPIARRRPSHKKEIKDSMNLEQSLSLCRELRSLGFDRPSAFVSSNTQDFAESPTSPKIHADLVADFASVSLDYYPNLRAAIGSLRTAGEVP